MHASPCAVVGRRLSPASSLPAAAAAGASNLPILCPLCLRREVNPLSLSLSRSRCLFCDRREAAAPQPDVLLVSLRAPPSRQPAAHCNPRLMRPDLRLRFLELHRTWLPTHPLSLPSLPRVTFLYKGRSHPASLLRFLIPPSLTLGTPKPPCLARSLRLFHLRLHFYSFSQTNSAASRPSAVAAAVARNVPGDRNETRRRMAADTLPDSTACPLLSNNCLCIII